MAEPNAQPSPPSLKVDEWASMFVYGFKVKEQLAGLRSADLSEPASTFVLNTINHCVLSTLPAILFTMGRQYQLAEVAAHIQLHGKPIPDGVTGVFFPTPDVAKLRDAFLRHEEKPPFELWAGSSSKDAFDYSLGFAQDQFRTLMTTQLVMCWTAFEALASDLWVACLNARPKLGFKAMGAEITPDDDEQEQERKKRVKFSLPIWLLDRWDYQLKGKMGDLLQRKWDFGRRNEMEDAYGKVFGPDKEAGAALRATFRDKELLLLHGARNVLVHNAGRVDEEFERVTKGATLFGPVKQGQMVHIDGAVCVKLVESACGCGIRLLNFVDEWLVNNPGS